MTEGEVTQEDRDTFFAIGEAEGWEIEDRSYDDDPTMQLLVRHRLAALSSATPAEDVVERVAEALANQRVMRNGSPPIKGILSLIPPTAAEEVRDNARAALAIQPPPDVAQMQAEIERLREVVRRANSQAEIFERKWYLESDKTEAAEAKLAEAVEALEGIKDDIENSDVDGAYAIAKTALARLAP